MLLKHYFAVQMLQMLDPGFALQGRLHATDGEETISSLSQTLLVFLPLLFLFLMCRCGYLLLCHLEFKSHFASLPMRCTLDYYFF